MKGNYFLVTKSFNCLKARTRQHIALLYYYACWTAMGDVTGSILHLESLLQRPSSSHPSRFFHSMTTCVCGSPARTTWSAFPCCALTAQHPSSPRLPSYSGPSTPSQACAAGAPWALRAITARQRSTCATPTPAWTEGCAPAGRAATPASAVKTTAVSHCWQWSSLDFRLFIH